MKAIGIRELKTHLSEYIRRVRGGEQVPALLAEHEIAGLLDEERGERKYPLKVSKGMRNEHKP